MLKFYLLYTNIEFFKQKNEQTDIEMYEKEKVILLFLKETNMYDPNIF